MKRSQHIIPGYDCRYVPCAHPTKGDHGICADQWIYVVTDDAGGLALSLTVYSATYPATVPEQVRSAVGRDPFGSDLAYHSALRTREWQSSPNHPKCDWLGGVPCYGDVTFIGGRDFWLDHNTGAQHEQGESFWRALESKAATWFAELQASAEALRSEVTS